MRFPMTEETLWIVHTGECVAVKDLDDNHLLNIINHTQSNVYYYGQYIVDFFKGVAEKRGLKIVSKAIPYKRFGKWILWSPSGIKTFVGERKLDIDICKKCKMCEYDGYWSKEDEQYFNEGKSICFKECEAFTEENAVPKGCNYLKEQLARKEKENV